MSTMTETPISAAQVKDLREKTGAPMMDCKNALTEARSELTDKDREIERLQKAFARTDETVEFRGKHYRKGADGKPKGRPFCTVCWEEGRLFLLDRDIKGVRGAMKCARCKATFDALQAFADDGGTE